MELVGDWGEDFGDCKGSFSFGGKFQVGDRASQAFSLQSHLISFFKGFKTLIVSGGNDLVGKFMSSKSFISGSIEEF